MILSLALDNGKLLPHPRPRQAVINNYSDIIVTRWMRVSMLLPLVPLESYEWVRCGLWTKIGIGKNQHALRAMSTSANTQEQDEKRAKSHGV